MLEIRWHGRGGQGAVTSVELFALAANLNVGTHAAADRMAEARLAAAQSQSRWGGGAEA